MLSFDVNWWAVIAATAVNMFLGAAWYSPAGFGKQWAKLTGKKMESMGGGANTGYSVLAAGALVQSFLLANIIRDTGTTTVSDGLLLGFMVWLGFVATTTLGDVAFGGRPWKLWQLNTAYFLVVLVLNGWLLTVWV